MIQSEYTHTERENKKRRAYTMTKNYRGYEIRTYETMGIGKGTCFEVWRDGQMWGFASNELDAEIMIDRMIEK